jgi:hypothetical protein
MKRTPMIESKEFWMLNKPRRLLFPHIEARIANIEKYLNILKIKDKEMGEPGTYDYMLISLYAVICSTNMLQEQLKDLIASSKRLEILMYVLIILTIVLAGLTVKLIFMVIARANCEFSVH